MTDLDWLKALRERHYEEPIALGVFGWAMVVLLACAVLGLALLGG